MSGMISVLNPAIGCQTEPPSRVGHVVRAGDTEREVGRAFWDCNSHVNHLAGLNAQIYLAYDGDVVAGACDE